MIAESATAVISLLQSPWVLLIIFASLLYAAGNYIDELLLCKYEQEVGTLVIISTLFGAVIAGIFLFFAHFFEISIFLDKPIIVQALFIGVLEAIWVIPYLYATERSGALIAGPLFQAVPVFALVFESLLGTIPPLLQMVGASIIVLGGIIISIEKEEDEEGNTSHAVNWPTILMMSISAVIVSLIYVLFRDAAIATNFVAVGFWTGLGTFLTGLVIYTLWEPYQQQFNAFCKNANYKAFGLQFFNEILDAGGVYMTNLATTLGPSVMVVTAFNATQPIAVGVIGFLLSYFGVTSISSDKTKTSGWLFVSFGILLIAAGIIVLAVGGYE